MTTIIFDMDGVLVDSSELTIRIISGLLSPLADCPGSRPERICETFGMSMTDMWEYLMPCHTRSMQKEMSDAYDVQIVKGLEGAGVLIPGVREVLVELKEQGYRLTVASNCGIPYLDAVLDSQKIRDFFTDPKCLESVQGSEKADILRWHLKQNPGFSIMVGDRSSDVQAAHRTGIPCIGIKSIFTKESELEEAEEKIQNIRELPAAIQRMIQSLAERNR